MKTRISNDEAQRYFDNCAVFCPKCGSENLALFGFEFEEGGIYQPVKCDACDAEWTEAYRLNALIADNGVIARK